MEKRQSLRLKLGVGAVVLVAVTLLVLNSCNRTTTTEFTWPDANPPTKVVFKTRRSMWPGKRVPNGHVFVDELVFQYGDYSVRVTGDKIGVEDPILYNLDEVDYVALFQYEDVVALRLSGSDGGFSHTTILVFRLGKLVHSETMWLEDYRLLLSQGHKDSDIVNDEKRGLAPWLLKHRR